MNSTGGGGAAPDLAPTLRGVPGFGRLWAASTTSAFGTYVTLVAIQLLVAEVLDGSSVDMGLVNAARWVPYLVLGLLAGVLVDRVRRRPLLVLTDALSAVTLAAIPVLALTGRLTVPGLMALMVVFGLCTVVGDAAFQAFIPTLVPRALLGPAHVRLDQSDAVAQVSSPAVGGGLVSLLGAPLAVLVDAASYAVSAAVLSTLRVDEPRAPRDPARAGWRAAARSVGSEVAEGVRWVYRHPTLRPLALSTHAWFVCSATVGAVLALFVLRTLHLGPAALGLALAVAGVGALVGSSWAVRLGRRFGAGRVVVVARIGTGLAWGLMAAAALAVPPGTVDGDPVGPGAWVVLALGQLLLGLCMGAENANEMSYRQAATPDRLQGRMNATMRSVNRAVVVVGAPLGGLLGEAVGYGVTLVVAGAVLATTAVAAIGSGLWGARLGDRHTPAPATSDAHP